MSRNRQRRGGRSVESGTDRGRMQPLRASLARCGNARILLQERPCAGPAARGSRCRSSGACPNTRYRGGSLCKLTFDERHSMETSYRDYDRSEPSSICAANDMSHSESRAPPYGRPESNDTLSILSARPYRLGRRGTCRMRPWHASRQGEISSLNDQTTALWSRL